jgi:hypothetical protein
MEANATSIAQLLEIGETDVAITPLQFLPGARRSARRTPGATKIVPGSL